MKKYIEEQIHHWQRQADAAENWTDRQLHCTGIVGVLKEILKKCPDDTEPITDIELPENTYRLSLSVLPNGSQYHVFEWTDTVDTFLGFSVKGMIWQDIDRSIHALVWGGCKIGWVPFGTYYSDGSGFKKWLESFSKAATTG